MNPRNTILCGISTDLTLEIAHLTGSVHLLMLMAGGETHAVWKEEKGSGRFGTEHGGAPASAPGHGRIPQQGPL